MRKIHGYHFLYQEQVLAKQLNEQIITYLTKTGDWARQ